MEEAQIKINNQKKTMGEKDNPPFIDSVEQFPALVTTEETPNSPPKTKRMSRKSGDITMKRIATLFGVSITMVHTSLWLKESPGE